MPRFLVDRLRDPSQFITVPDHGLERLLHGLIDDFSIVRARFHRYMSEVDGVSPAAGSTTERGMMGVVPLVAPDGQSIWDRPPEKKDASSLRSMYFAPYHAALAVQIAQVRALHGFAVVLNCRGHSVVPGFADKVSPVDVGLSTYMGTTCDVTLSTRLAQFLKTDPDHVMGMSGRDAAGWTIRHYGRPKSNTHAVDLDLNEARYLTFENQTALYDGQKAMRLRGLLGDFMRLLADWRPKGFG